MSVKGIVVRRLGKADDRAARAALARIEKLTPARGLARLLADKKAYLVVAYDGTDAVGYALAYELPAFRRTMLYLHSIEVAENQRRQGVGRALIQHLKRVCRKQAIGHMFLFTTPGNSAAIRLYESTGGGQLQKDHAEHLLFEYRF